MWRIGRRWLAQLRFRGGYEGGGPINTPGPQITPSQSTLLLRHASSLTWSTLIIDLADKPRAVVVVVSARAPAPHVLCTHHSFLTKRSMDRSPLHSRLSGESRYYPRRYAKIVLVNVDIDLRKWRTGLCMCIILKVNCWSQVDMLTSYHQRWRYLILFTIVGLHFK